MPVLVKRAYDKPAKSDGIRVLVERAWPRGLGKSSAMLDHWMPELAPSERLDRTLQSKTSNTSVLQRRYFAELSTPEAMAALEKLHSFAARAKPLSLLYAAKEPSQSAAAMLRDLLEGGRKPPSGSGPGHAATGTGQLRAIRKGK